MPLIPPTRDAENHLNSGGRGCVELRLRHCTPAWVTRAKLRLKKKKKISNEDVSSEMNHDIKEFCMSSPQIRVRKVYKKAKIIKSLGNKLMLCNTDHHWKDCKLSASKGCLNQGHTQNCSPRPGKWKQYRLHLKIKLSCKEAGQMVSCSFDFLRKAKF